MIIGTIADLRALRARCAGAVFAPGDPGWDEARRAWCFNVDQRPAAVALPESESDVVATVEFAREAGLRVAAQSTGHNATPLGALDGTILIRTSAMRGVSIDPDQRRARVRAGALWQDVVPRAAEHGLAALHGSSPTVGVVGYSLGGGLGWLARRHGLQANRITAAELVTAEGERVRADDECEPALLWALRGGGGSFGFVTALEFELLPVRRVYAGALAWDWHKAGDVLSRFGEWAPTAPELITASARIMQVPPIAEAPTPLRGRRLATIDGAYLGDPADGDAVLAPLRGLRPEIDTFAPMPAASLARLQMDPETPTPVVSDHRMLAELPRDAVEAFLAAAGADSGSTLTIAALRQLGGALARRPERHGALPCLDGSFAMMAAGLAVDEEMAAAHRAQAHALATALEPWSNARRYSNMQEQSVDARSFFDEETLDRLRAVRRQVDPTGVFHANHPVGR